MSTGEIRTDWFYESDGKPAGPVTDEELQRLIAAGTVTSTSRVWRPGLGDWQPLGEARPDRSGSASGRSDDSDRDANGGDRASCVACGVLFPAAHPQPAEGGEFCPACRPAASAGDRALGVDAEFASPPWEDRSRIGFVPALLGTVQTVLFQPLAAFETMRRDGAVRGAYLYFLILGFGCGVVELAYRFFLSLQGGQVGLPSNYVGQPGAEAVDLLVKSSQSPQMVAIAGGTLLATWMPLSPLILGGMIHLCLVLFGGGKARFEGTLRAFCYAWGTTYVFELIPACGSTIHLFWGIVLLCLALAKAHRTSMGTATAAVLVPFVSLLGAFILLFALLAAVLVSTMHHPS